MAFFLKYDTNSNKINKRLNMIREAWRTKAWINRDKNYLDCVYDKNRPDFPYDFLPFYKHPIIQGLNQGERHKLLSAAWIMYVDRTIDIERNIVTPACRLIVDGVFKLPQNTQFGVPREVMQQTIIDEEFHILLTMYPRNLSARMNNLENLSMSNFLVVEKLSEARSMEKSQMGKNIATLAFACVSEMATNVFLTFLSQDLTIQPWIH